MADLIILRLLPGEAVSGADFSDYLTGLTITAFERSFANSTDGIQIGTAGSPWIPPSNPNDPALDDIDITANQILQHFEIVTYPITQIDSVVLKAVATAVIEVTLPAGHQEYPATGARLDVRLEVQRGALEIADDLGEYNVPIVSVSSLPSDPDD